MVEMTPRKRPKQKRSKMTVDAILTATTRILIEGGYDKLNTNYVAQVAGVSVGTLYQYFPNKESLVLAVFEEHAEEMLGLLRRASSALRDVPLETAVRAYIQTMIEAHCVDPELHRTLIRQALHLGVHIHQHIQSEAIAIVRSYLELHKDTILPNNLDIAAFLLVTMVESATHNMVVEYPDMLKHDDVAEELACVVLRYLLPSTHMVSV